MNAQRHQAFTESTNNLIFCLQNMRDIAENMPISEERARLFETITECGINLQAMVQTVSEDAKESYEAMKVRTQIA